MKVAIYCRLSEEDKNKTNSQDDSESIQNQKSLLINYAISNNWDIFHIYSDDDFSGSDRNRPAFNQLISDAKDKKFDIILCKSQSRFTRELELVEKYIHGLFVEWKIRFIGVADSADTDNVGNKKSRQINAMVNEWYLEDLSNNIKSVLKNKCKEGKHIGSFARYGYKKQGKNELIIDDEAAEVVKMIYNLYLDGNGAGKIANILNQQNILNPSGYKKKYGSNYKPAKLDPKGYFWSYPTVTAMLREQIYAGDLVQHKIEKVSYKSEKQRRVPKKDWIIAENSHEAIIDKQTWQKVQAMMDSKSKPSKAGTVHVLAGKCVCADCGKILASNYAKGVKYLRCPTRDVKKELCVGASIQLKYAENAVLEEINRLSQEYFDTDYIEKGVTLEDNAEIRLEKLKKQQIKIEKEKEDFESAISASYLDKVKGFITESEFVKFNNKFSQEIEGKTAELTKLQQEIDEINQSLQNRVSKRELVEKYKNVTELTRVMVLELVDKVEIGKKKDGEIPINIFWNF
ncbi:MAG: recombinase family protein [Clostridia bacterium]